MDFSSFVGGSRKPWLVSSQSTRAGGGMPVPLGQPHRGGQVQVQQGVEGNIGRGVVWGGVWFSWQTLGADCEQRQSKAGGDRAGEHEIWHQGQGGQGLDESEDGRRMLLLASHECVQYYHRGWSGACRDELGQGVPEAGGGVGVSCVHKPGPVRSRLYRKCQSHPQDSPWSSHVQQQLSGDSGVHVEVCPIKYYPKFVRIRRDIIKFQHKWGLSCAKLRLGLGNIDLVLWF